MKSISHLWTKNKKIFETKTLSQILAFTGDGRLTDGNATSHELRDLLEQVPSKLLMEFSENCLSTKFDGSGFALQDIVNQIGVRLGFEVNQGLYRGKRNGIGYDGIWTSSEGYSIVVEVKTTDTYRINMNTIASYRDRLIENAQIDKSRSSILIVVGRNDTGDLEAQIRGSRHAWDVRLISTESLIKLLKLKETFNDTRTIRQINELLKPQEYTRIDSLIDLLFLTSKDLQLDEIEEDSVPQEEVESLPGPKFSRVNFHNECIYKIQKHLELNFKKQSRIAYDNKDKTVGLICSISKIHDPGKNESYWFSLYPHQQEFLQGYQNSYISYGCGSSKNTLLIPYAEFEPYVGEFWTTENEQRMYYHVVILHRNNKFLLQLPKAQSVFDLSKYKI
ncbi:hypothetical protein [Ulvibacterium sp.]|uniref:hypothetical protein n=1 Tax=Ulvibacterium sp. TaxID=2665914 RepID=UPI0026033BBB|nr:hypothetical protein [Ulvibacterium sp.]